MIEQAFGGEHMYELDDKSSSKRRMKAKIYTFLEDPMSSTAAKVADNDVVTCAFKYLQYIFEFFDWIISTIAGVFLGIWHTACPDGGHYHYVVTPEVPRRDTAR